MWTGLMLAALALEMIAYPPGEFGAAREPYPTQSRLLLIGGWLIGLAVAARLLIGLRREAI